jgi:hypothetical protein
VKNAISTCDPDKYDPNLPPDANIARAGFAIAAALRSIGVHLKYLGNGSASTEMGAIESLAVQLREGLDGLSQEVRAGLEGVSMSQSDALATIATSLDDYTEAIKASQLPKE